MRGRQRLCDAAMLRSLWLLVLTGSCIVRLLQPNDDVWKCMTDTRSEEAAAGSAAMLGAGQGFAALTIHLQAECSLRGFAVPCGSLDSGEGGRHGRAVLGFRVCAEMHHRHLIIIFINS